MAQKVRTPYSSAFQMPNTCMSCGAPAEAGLYYCLDKTQSNWPGKKSTTLNLNFPICAECHAVSASRRGANVVIVIGIIISLLVCGLSAVAANSLSNQNALITIISAGTLFFISAILFRWFARLINEKGLTPENKRRRRNLLKAGSVKQFKVPGTFDKTGFIDFQFENAPFAASFALLNRGKLL